MGGNFCESRRPIFFKLNIWREKTLQTLQKIDTVGTTLHLQNLFKRDHLVAIRKNSFPPKIKFLKFTFRYPIFVFMCGSVHCSRNNVYRFIH